MYGTFDLVGRSVLKLRISSVGTGFKSQYWLLSGFALVAPAFASFLTIGLSLESASAEPEKLLATANMIADAMHQIMRIARSRVAFTIRAATWRIKHRWRASRSFRLVIAGRRRYRWS